MKRLTTPLLISCSAALLFAFAGVGCATDGTTGFRNALTGEECVPDDTLRPGKNKKDKSDRDHGNTSPTGIPGDNMDDSRSGKVDCLFDGDSGQGNDTENCEPPPGCDQNGCCEDDDQPGDDDRDEDGDSDESVDEDCDHDDTAGDTTGGDTTGGDGDGDSDPSACPAEDVCQVDTDCGSLEVCSVDGCCTAIVD